MTNNNEEGKFGAQGSIGIGSGRKFESQGQGPGSDKVDQGKQPQDHTDDDDVKTAGGREGNFADSKRGNEDQWSPGSTQSSDQ